MTWIRKTSASRGRQSALKARKIKFSPFWLKTRIPLNMVSYRVNQAAMRRLVEIIIVVERRMVALYGCLAWSNFGSTQMRAEDM
jgi:hypothetical protein